MPERITVRSFTQLLLNMWKYLHHCSEPMKLWEAYTIYLLLWELPCYLEMLYIYALLIVRSMLPLLCYFRESLHHCPVAVSFTPLLFQLWEALHYCSGNSENLFIMALPSMRSLTLLPKWPEDIRHCWANFRKLKTTAVQIVRSLTQFLFQSWEALHYSSANYKSIHNIVLSKYVMIYTFALPFVRSLTLLLC